MVYITQKTIDEANEINDILEEVMAKVRNKSLCDRIMNNPILTRYMDIAEKDNSASKKREHNGTMCVKCDCYAVRMIDHQQTYKCRKAFETKQFAVYDKKAINPEIVLCVNKIIAWYRNSKNRVENANKKYAKNIKNLTFERKLKIYNRTKRVMEKKKNGIALETLTPYEIIKQKKQAKLDIVPAKPKKKKLVIVSE